MDPVLTTLIGGIMAAIVAMWKYFLVRANKCEKDREEIRERLSATEKTLAVFKGCPESDCPALSALRRMETFSVDPKP